MESVEKFRDVHARLNSLLTKRRALSSGRSKCSLTQILSGRRLILSLMLGTMNDQAAFVDGHKESRPVMRSRRDPQDLIGKVDQRLDSRPRIIAVKLSFGAWKISQRQNMFELAGHFKLWR